MRKRALPAAPSSLRTRRARFEDVPEILRLIRRAVERGCRADYDPTQRETVWSTYASSLFLDVLGPLETIVAERNGRLAGVAQVDLPGGRLRALFVDAELQGQGLGRALLADVEERAVRGGCVRLFGAMSLNAVPFYTRMGFHPSSGPRRLTAADRAVPVVRMEKALQPRLPAG